MAQRSGQKWQQLTFQSACPIRVKVERFSERVVAISDEEFQLMV